MLVDLHCHTAQKSDDSSLTFEQLGPQARAHGVEVVCITEHDSFWEPAILQHASEKAGVLLLPGSEINTDAGHVIVFGLEEYRFGYHHPNQLIDAVRSVGGATVLAHPYRRALSQGLEPAMNDWDAALDRATENPLLKVVDAIETQNGRGTELQNKFAGELARLAGLPTVGSSDAHSLPDIGVAATHFESSVASLADLIDELKAARFVPATPES